jgi:hypothetical protein
VAPHQPNGDPRQNQHDRGSEEGAVIHACRNKNSKTERSRVS